MAKRKRLHKITFSGIKNISIRPVFSKLPSKQPNNFPPSSLQTSNIERPNPRVTHHDEFALGQTQTTPQDYFLQASKTYTKSSMVNFNQTLI